MEPESSLQHSQVPATCPYTYYYYNIIIIRNIIVFVRKIGFDPCSAVSTAVIPNRGFAVPWGTAKTS
jgi:hypothetical protein